MSKSARFYFMAFMALAPVLHAQSAMNSGAILSLSASTLPLRNLLIEVRQVSESDSNDTTRRQRGEATLSPGASSAQWEIQGQRPTENPVNQQPATGLGAQWPRS
jgi:hypothetical protein